MSDASSDVVVIGAGPAGLAAALALAEGGVGVVIAAPAYDGARASRDTRSTALLSSSIALIKNLNAWGTLAAQSAPLRAIRIIDDRGSLLRAPQVDFRAAELAMESFGANIANPALIGALTAAARAHPRIGWHATAAVNAVIPRKGSVRVTLAEGAAITARLVVGADGANSLARSGAGIAAFTWSYPQAAIAATVSHGRSQEGTTTELHRRCGPLTVIPLGADQASIVWVEEPRQAQRLADLGNDAFLAELATALKGVLGPLTDVAPRAIFFPRGLRAQSMGRRRIALVGEAAHVIPPIGAQGLNLGLRDAAVLGECVATAHDRGLDIGGAETLAAYDAARAGDVLTRSVLVDLLNRSLLTDFLPLAAARGIGLHLLANAPQLRRLVVAGGLQPLGALPRLMRPAALSP